MKVAAVRQIAGSWWNTKKKVWEAPRSSLSQALQFARNFRMNVPEELESMELKVIEEQAQKIAASRSLNAEIEVPDLVGELLPYQKAGVQYLVDHKKLFLVYPD